MANNAEWLNLSNPFKPDASTIIGHISGRRTDIIEITSSSPGGIILAGAPKIGKSTLVHYLKEPSSPQWNWRDELADLREPLHLDDIHFVYVDLRLEEGTRQSIKTSDKLLNFFIEQCISALRVLVKDEHVSADDRKGSLFRLIRNIQHNDKRCFIMLDNIDHLAKAGIELLDLSSRAQTDQERGIALLEKCGAIRIMADLLDEFTHFGVILAIESLPRPRTDDQFALVSADLARFNTTPLQTLTWEDTEKLLEQPLENFSDTWEDIETFRHLGGECIFSRNEQAWLQEQAGTHPYLLQQFCFYTFHFKRKYAYNFDHWTEIKDDEHKQQVLEEINGRLTTFLKSLWTRIKEALEVSSQTTRDRYSDFIQEIKGKSARDILNTSSWSKLGEELHYILRSEGIIRHDPLLPIHYPGAVLTQYLVQKAKQNSSLFTSRLPSPLIGKGHWLIINNDDNQEPLPLTDIEYGLLKTLLRNPQRCSDTDLMLGGWGKVIDKSAFMQRMHQLRKKLKQRFGGIEIIENRYGGFYLLNHSDWFQLE